MFNFNPIFLVTVFSLQTPWQQHHIVLMLSVLMGCCEQNRNVDTLNEAASFRVLVRQEQAELERPPAHPATQPAVPGD